MRGVRCRRAASSGPAASATRSRRGRHDARSHGDARPRRPAVLSLTEKEMATLKAFHAAMDARDATALGAIYTPDAVFKFAGMPDMSKDVFLAHQKDHFASFPDSKGARVASS